LQYCEFRSASSELFAAAIIQYIESTRPSNGKRPSLGQKAELTPIAVEVAGRRRNASEDISIRWLFGIIDPILALWAAERSDTPFESDNPER